MRVLNYIVGTVLKNLRPHSSGDLASEAAGELKANPARIQERQELRRRAGGHSQMHGLLVR